PLLPADDHHAMIEVRDNGIGMQPDSIPSMFEPFSQGKVPAGRIHEGLGLGLALVKSLVELHQGTLDAQSEGANQGSTFSIRLPLPAEPGPPTPKPIKAKHRFVARHVLVIDDCPEVVQALSMLLKVSGHHVTTASDGLNG